MLDGCNEHPHLLVLHLLYWVWEGNDVRKQGAGRGDPSQVAGALP